MSEPLDAGRTAAATVGRVGVWFGPSLAGAPARQAREVARRVEALGFGCLWIGESPGYREAFTHAALLLDATQRLVVATGIANIWVRDPMAASAAADGLAEASGSRFVLGLGASHAALVEQRGHAYGTPLAAMRQYVEALDTAGYRGTAPDRRPPRVLAALRPRMQDLARDATDGVHTFCTTPEHTAATRARLGAVPLLAAEQAVVVEDDAPSRAVARAYLGTRLALPNYRNNFLSLGFSEDDVRPPGTDALVDGLVAWRGLDDAGARVGRHLEAGADHVAVHVLSGDGSGSPERSDLDHELDALERLATGPLAGLLADH